MNSAARSRPHSVSTVAGRLPMLVTALALASCANSPEPVVQTPVPAPRGIQQQATGTALRWVACVDCEAPTAKTMPFKSLVADGSSRAGTKKNIGQLLSKAPTVLGLAPAPTSVSSEAVAPRVESAPTPRPVNETTLTRATVNFGLADASLSEQDRERLRQLKPLLASARRIRITGYTDTQGGSESNDRLASSRALAVVLYLRDGLGLSGPEVIGTGRPLCCYRAPNTSEGGRAQNRRAELDIELPADADSDALIKQHASRLTPTRASGTAS